MSVGGQSSAQPGAMTESVVERGLRRFLLLTVLGICLATVIELWLTEHYQEPTQVIPFALCVISLLAVSAVIAHPSRVGILVLRGTMVLLGTGGVLGVGLHLFNNFAFEREIRPNAALVDVIINALRGVNPLLAPGILALAAALAIAATYRHPVLHRG
jgi:hypothetical protein